jgi:hypothetical protein
MSSDDSDKDRYQPDVADLMQEVTDDEEVENEDILENDVEIESDERKKKVVVTKKGKKPKPGRRDIAAIRTSIPTTGTKSALEHSKRRERSPR